MSLGISTTTQPVWVTHPENANIDDVCLSFVQMNYDRLKAQLEDEGRIQPGDDLAEIEDRLKAEASDASYNQQANIRELMDRVSVRTLLFMQENNYFRLLPGEPAEVVEYLVNKVKPGYDGADYQIGFMVDFLIPALIRSGFSYQDIFSLKDGGFSKAKLAVHPLKVVFKERIFKARRIKQAIENTTNQEEISRLQDELNKTLTIDDDSLNLLREVMAGIANKNVTVEQFGADLRGTQIQRAAKDRYIPAEAIEYILPEGSILQIKIENERQKNAIAIALNGLVDVHLGEIEELTTDVYNMVLQGGT